MISEGGRYGATYVDEYFLNVFLRDKLGQEEYEKLCQIGRERPGASGGAHIVRRRGEQIMLDRFQPIKHGFAGREDDGTEPEPDIILLPDEIGEQLSPDRGIRDGQLKITWLVDLLYMALHKLSANPR